MVRLFLFWFITSLMFRDRAFNTIHQALTISGSSCSTRAALTPLVHLTSHVAYKYIRAGLVNPLSILNVIP